MNKSRLEAFSDGVIAIIITIMVLELKVPKAGDWSSLRALCPVFFGYLLSFVFIGIYWGNHHHLLHTVKKVSSALIWANLNLLFWLSIVPFATGWMSTTNFSPFTVAAYAVLLNICGLAYTILQLVIKRISAHEEGLALALKKQTKKGVWSLIGYTSAIPMAYIDIRISEALFVLVAILWLIPDKNIEKALNE
jgi:uncharacterized membrane protein